jgi:hypothetical protein
MNATTLMSKPTMRPINWTDIIEAYRPAAMSQSRSTRTRRPTASLCISAFQAGSYLQDTIDSCLAQRDAEVEVVIVDNNCSSGAREILNAVRDDLIQIIHSATTVPIADGFNLAVQHSSGEFVKLTYAGDTLHPDCIAKQAKVLKANPDVALVAVRTDYIDEEGKHRANGCRLAGLVGRYSAGCVIKRIARNNADPIGPSVSGSVPTGRLRSVRGLSGRRVVSNGYGPMAPVAGSRRLRRCARHSRVVADARWFGGAAHFQGDVSSAWTRRRPMKQRRTPSTAGGVGGTYPAPPARRQTSVRSGALNHLRRSDDARKFRRELRWRLGRR